MDILERGNQRGKRMKEVEKIVFILAIIGGFLLGAGLGIIYQETIEQEIKEDLAEDYSICLWAVVCIQEPNACLLEGYNERNIEQLILYCIMQPNIDKYIEEGLMEDFE